jgi:pimeloyl-ACP methyl ester carboxylesterase
VYNPHAKKAILAVHGLRGTHHGLQFIAQKLPEYAVITPDLPGHGASEPLDDTHSTANYSRFLEDFVQKINLPRPHIVLGHSFGCSIVGKFAKDNHETIQKLILINPVVSGGHPLGTLIAKSFYKLGNILPEKIGTRLLRSRINTRLMTLVITTTKRKRLRKRVYEQHLAYFSSFADRRTVSETFHSTLTEMVTDHADELTMPTLMIIGLKDRLAPPSGQRELYQKLANAQLKSIPYVGHLIHYETPELAARYIKEFIG